MKSREATYWIEYDNGTEIEWTVPYSWSKPMPATRLDPAEGGAEQDGDPWVSRVIWTDERREVWDVKNIQEGSVLGLLLEAKYEITEDEQDWAIEDNLVFVYGDIEP